MVKSKDLTKAEIIQIFETTKISKERNRAAKLLKAYDPVKRYELDEEAKLDKLKVIMVNHMIAFVCWRCGKVCQTKTKCHWTTSKGVKKICLACHNTLESDIEVKQLKADHVKMGLVQDVPWMSKDRV